jgi:hypothetical protein
MHHWKKILLALTLCALPIIASAGVLDGQSGTLYYLYPDTSTPLEVHPFTGPTSITTVNVLVNTIGGNTIYIDLGPAAGGTFFPVAFNGEDFNFPGLTLTSVTYSSNFVGPWSWGPHDIWVNWEGMGPIQSDSYVQFQVSASTPEPGTWVMMGSGVIGLAGLLRRKLLL